MSNTAVNEATKLLPMTKNDSKEDEGTEKTKPSCCKRNPKVALAPVVSLLMMVAALIGAAVGSGVSVGIVQTKLDNACKEMIDSIVSKMDLLEMRVNNITSANQEILSQFQNRTTSDIMDMSEQLGTLGENISQLALEMNRTVSQMEDHIHQVSNESLSASQAAKSELQVKINELTTDTENNFTQMKEELQEQLQEKDNQLATDMMSNFSRVEEQILKISRNETSSSLQAAKRELQEQINQLANDTRKNFSQVEKLVIQASNTTRTELLGKIASTNDILNVFQYNTTTVVQEFEQSLKTINTTLSECIEEISTQLGSRVSEVNNTFSSSLMAAKNEMQANIDKLATEMRNNFTQQQAGLQNEVLHQLEAISGSIYVLNATVSRQISENKEMITLLATEALRNHTQLQATLASLHITLNGSLAAQKGLLKELHNIIERLENFQLTATGDITLMKDEIEVLEINQTELQGELDTAQRQLYNQTDTLETDQRQLHSQMDTLETDHDNIKTGLEALNSTVIGYHSNTATPVLGSHIIWVICSGLIVVVVQALTT